MDLNNLFLFFILITFLPFFYKWLLPNIEKYKPKLLMDDQLTKPQAFHEKATSIAGGVGIFFSLIIVYLNYFFFKNILYFEYFSFCTLFFLLGFLDDIKININPITRLFLMIVLLFFLIYYNNYYIEFTGIEILNEWIKEYRFFSLIFMSLCFLFIVNGANLIDGYNGLLSIHSLIILINLFLINFFNENLEFSFLLIYIILIIFIFLFFNFPKAKVFLGDSGSYLLGIIISISAIETSKANPDISPFYFCIILFYLFFEVFFSFFRKSLIEKKSPILPDEKHLHMLLYKILTKKNNDKIKSNYYVSIIINFVYLSLTFPAILMMENGMFCKFYSIVLFITYVLLYIKASKRI